MKALLFKYKSPFALFLTASIWMLLNAFVFQLYNQKYVFGDSFTYLNAAKKLYVNHQIDEARPIIISVINGFPLLFGFSESTLITWSVLVNLGCWMSTILLIYGICKSQFNSKTAFYTALLFILCLGNLFISFHVLSESIFTFFLISALFFINKFIQTNRAWFLSIAFAILISSILIKPVTFGLLLLLLFSFYKELDAVLKSKSVVFVGIGLSLVLIQIFSLKKNYGDYKISYIDAFTYYNYLGTRADCLSKNVVFEQGKSYRYESFSKLSCTEQNRVAREDLMTQIKENKWNLIKAYFINFYSNSTKGSAAVFAVENSSYEYVKWFYKGVSKLQNIVFSLFGIVLSFFYILKRKQKGYSLQRIISIAIGYIMAISAISSDQGDRFHLVTFPFVLVLLAKCVSDKLKHSKLSKL